MLIPNVLSQEDDFCDTQNFGSFGNKTDILITTEDCKVMLIPGILRCDGGMKIVSKWDEYQHGFRGIFEGP